MALLAEVYRGGGLDLETRDGIITWLAIILGIFFLLRSSEYLRSGDGQDEKKCIRVRNVLFALDSSEVNCADDVECDEVAIFHEFSKNDFLGQGACNNNILRACSDRRFCVVPWVDILRQTFPEALSSSDAFLLRLENGKVLHRGCVESLLSGAAVRLKLPPKLLAVHMAFVQAAHRQCTTRDSSNRKSR